MILYADTSSIVKLYIDEEGFQSTRALSASAEEITTSIIAYVEMRSALAHKLRRDEIARPNYNQALEDFERDWSSYTIIPMSQELASSAASLAERHALRALDAIHLASAKGLAEKIVDPLVFLSADNELLQAAVQEGLATSP